MAAENNDFSPGTDPQSPPDSPREIGYVKWFDHRKKYGFIRREDGSDVFVHFSEINGDQQVLNEHERVELTVVPGKKGPEAHNVVVLTPGS